jgi:trimethylamine:corrinoid methyltransferase-like protein
MITEENEKQVEQAREYLLKSLGVGFSSPTALATMRAHGVKAVMVFDEIDEVMSLLQEPAFFIIDQNGDTYLLGEMCEQFLKQN